MNSDKQSNKCKKERKKKQKKRKTKMDSDLYIKKPSYDSSNIDTKEN